MTRSQARTYRIIGAYLAKVRREHDAPLENLTKALASIYAPSLFKQWNRPSVIASMFFRARHG